MYRYCIQYCVDQHVCRHILNALSFVCRYIFITGCDTGFGNLLAKRLDRLGCHVFAGCLTESGGSELKAQCTANLHVVRLDVSNSASVRSAYEVVKAALPAGKGRIGSLL